MTSAPEKVRKTQLKSVVSPLQDTHVSKKGQMPGLKVNENSYSCSEMIFWKLFLIENGIREEKIKDGFLCPKNKYQAVGFYGTDFLNCTIVWCSSFNLW